MAEVDEKAVIGSLLTDSSVVRFVQGEVAAEDFADVRLGKIFTGILSMVSAGEGVDPITVSTHLLEWGVAGITAPDLWSMAEVPTPANVGFYAQHVHEAGLKRSLGVLGAQITRDAQSGRHVTESISDAVEKLSALRDGARRDSLPVKSLGEVLAGRDDYDWVIPNLLERKDRLILTGGEGAGKSTFVRQLAVLSAAGIHPTTFKPIDPVKVLVVDAENSERQWRRAVRWFARRAVSHGSADPGQWVRLACVRRMDLTSDRDLGSVHALLDRGMPDVLFIGPLYRLVPRAIQSDDDAAPLLAALDSLRDRGPALVIEAHAGHSLGADGDRDLRPRGSSALMGWPEFGMGIRNPHVDGDSYKLVRWRGDRDERAWPKELIRGSMWPWEPVGEEF